MLSFDFWLLLQFEKSHNYFLLFVLRLNINYSGPCPLPPKEEYIWKDVPGKVVEVTQEPITY